MDAYGISSPRKRERESAGKVGEKEKKNVSMLKITTLRNLIADNMTQTSDILFH